MSKVPNVAAPDVIAVRTVGVQPGGHGWQDLFDVKITFDARRVTKHGSQTEVMMIFMRKGQEGVDSCQKADYRGARQEQGARVGSV